MKFRYFMDSFQPADKDAEVFAASLEEGDLLEVTKAQHRRSLDQNALLNIWARDYATHPLKKKPTDEQQEAMRITLQRACYAALKYDWLIEDTKDLFTGSVKKQRRSTTKFGKGEMTMFLDWIQHRAAEDGLVLEAKGEYLELSRSQVA